MISTMSWEESDEFEIPLTQTTTNFHALASIDNNQRPSKKPKRKTTTLDSIGKENLPPCEIENCSLDFIPSTIDCVSLCSAQRSGQEDTVSSPSSSESLSELKTKGNYLRNSIESKLVVSRTGAVNCAEAESDSELGLLLNLCEELEEVDSSVRCPLCEVDISNLTEEQRHLHTNNCLDEGDEVALLNDEKGAQHLPKVASVLDWLRGLGLEKYEDVFVREEVDWDTLQWLTEEDLLSMGITALGPRKKIVHVLCELRKGNAPTNEKQEDVLAEPRRIRNQKVKLKHDKSDSKVDGTSKPVANKLITEYFPGFASKEKKVSASPREQQEMKNSGLDSGRKHKSKNMPTNRKLRDVPKWCAVQGTPFRVDAFKYLRGDCSHWFLSHFHLDHYQGLTKSFNHGKIYCSSITARLVNMNIGISYDKLHVLPLNQKVEIAGIDVTCLDANHCPGSIIILFQPPNGKAVLHTGDFRFSEEMAVNPLLQMCPINTLILDTTYCHPQYDFPKQEAVIQFVIDAIQAEAFNPKTLFLIGSYTIGKERLFLEVARSLRKKVHVTAAKLRLLKCLEFNEEDMQWFTSNEHESNIHVAPMWTLASFKRLKHISSQYNGRYNLIVAFSPTGWTFGKGKKKSPGRRWQQGTIIRYEVPYSEHSSFTELKELVKLVSPDNIIPSVNNDGPQSSDAMISLLLS
ncbi:DNA cross-link repair protein SNM1 [Cajanus cajan]|uniref:DNA cross-link repair protein SNM1 n=1 Tax=Cajanus cajan TaxID=3821 RepID=UPI00098D7C8C|nr:DNA cross-link repair protein SNM1 [Cajanus cajan]